jgi:hypothetical protein
MLALSFCEHFLRDMSSSEQNCDENRPIISTIDTRFRLDIMTLATRTHPWILGTFAIYAANIRVARHVHDLVAHQEEHDGFGTVTLDTGEEIDWVDMRKIVPQPDLQ